MSEIEFDTVALAALTEKKLLVQICLRLDRSFPKWEDKVISADSLAAATALIEGYAADLTSKGFGDLAATVSEVIS